MACPETKRRRSLPPFTSIFTCDPPTSTERTCGASGSAGTCSTLVIVLGGSCGGCIGDDESTLGSDAPARNRPITFAQAAQCLDLVGARHEPQDLAGTVERWVRQCHAPTTLILGGDRDRTIGDLEHG